MAKIAICGGGIAGLTLAWWLRRDGHEVILVERAPALRDEGYMLDFFGSGWDVAEEMGLLGTLGEIHYPIAELVFVDERGAVRTALPYPRVRRLFDDRHFNFMRGDLERVLFEALEGAGVRFGTSVESLENGDDGVEVRLTDGSTDRFDLLVGADGVHSRVRELAMGGDPVLHLPYRAASYLVADDTLREKLGSSFRTLTVPGRQVGMYPIRGGKLAVFFVHERAREPDDGSGPGDVLVSVYRDLEWIVPQILAKRPDDAQIYFDGVDQVVLDSWTRGRVTLVGDACQAVSLLAGQGASMAMGGAWALARALREAGSIDEGCARYEAMVKPAIEKKQVAGRRTAKWFIPKSRPRIAFRDFMLRASTLPGMSFLLSGVLAGESIVTER